MKKWANELNRVFSKGSTNGQKTHEEMFNIPGYKRNVNQNHIKILPHSCENGYHQEHRQQEMLVRMCVCVKPSHTVGENVN
jgi:hypothetical protein